MIIYTHSFLSTEAMIEVPLTVSHNIQLCKPAPQTPVCIAGKEEKSMYTKICHVLANRKSRLGTATMSDSKGGKRSIRIAGIRHQMKT